MARLAMPSYTVIRDSKEKEGHGWIFVPQDHPKPGKPQCLGTTVEHLETGDYTISGFEDLAIIERKAGFSELWNNYLNKDTFEDEMIRMSEFKHKLIVIESIISLESMQLSPPQFKTKVPGKVLFRWLTNIMIKYDVPFIMVGQFGKQIAQMFFEEVIRVEKDRWVRR